MIVDENQFPIRKGLFDDAVDRLLQCFFRILVWKENTKRERDLCSRCLEKFENVFRRSSDACATSRNATGRWMAPGDRPGVPEERIHLIDRALELLRRFALTSTEPYETTRCNQFLSGRRHVQVLPKNRSDPFILQQGERLPALGTGRVVPQGRFPSCLLQLRSVDSITLGLDFLVATGRIWIRMTRPGAHRMPHGETKMKKMVISGF